ncbi:hypothetical protein LBMAG53_15130 [Planctomycetota bacterium]|nr:hypothetical protein LBMAG53_15130 [Planctomycetota bacterium]
MDRYPTDDLVQGCSSPFPATKPILDRVDAMSDRDRAPAEGIFPEILFQSPSKDTMKWYLKAGMLLTAPD